MCKEMRYLGARAGAIKPLNNPILCQLVEAPALPAWLNRREALRLQLLPELLEFTSCGWHDIATPDPGHFPLASCSRLVEVTHSASTLINLYADKYKYSQIIWTPQFCLDFLSLLN